MHAPFAFSFPFPLLTLDDASPNHSFGILLVDKGASFTIYEADRTNLKAVVGMRQEGKSGILINSSTLGHQFN